MSQYYYVGPDNQSHGPIMPQQCAQCGIHSQTLVCPVGGTQWVVAGTIPELQPYLNGAHNMGYQQPMQQQHMQQQHMQQQPSQINEMPPSNNMVWAILCTIFCCLPFGIVAIIKASNVKSAWYAGNRDLAIQNSKDAMKWCILSVISGVVVMFLAILANS
ncbi:MAG: CD225/dispanin family protein [Muribaculaceae bacterium]|nr:CD225/dispanin family protein [Muribaculaceae bacterium]